MRDFSRVIAALQGRGYEVKTFASGKEAADYINGAIDGKSVGIGGSATIRDLGIYELLSGHNEVYWHWQQDADEARKDAMSTEVYLTSVNALAETGELVNIDGMGNRVASTLFGHKKVYYFIGRNKLAPTYQDAVFRARNIAAPKRAKQVGANTPCAIKTDKCYDCKSSDRVCRSMVTLWGPMMGSEAEIILIDEDLGL